MLLVKEQPAEKLWSAMKRMAACERGTITSKQAVERVRSIVLKEGGTRIPDEALRFYAEEYLTMVRNAHKD